MQNANKIYTVYYPEYSPPKWVLNPKVWNKLSFDKSIIFFKKKDSLEEVCRTVTEREPVNIAMKRIYDRKKLKSKFGWETSYYQRYAEKHKYKKLAPNFAVYAYTPVKIPHMLKISKTKFVHVINLIGYAFDSPVQPDYKFFGGKTVSINKLLKLYTSVWKYAFICAKYYNLKKIHLANVGGSAFTPSHIAGLLFRERVYKPAVKAAQKEVDPEKKIKLIWDEYPEFKVPISFGNISQKILDETLYINAWDPHSMVGNGNEMDQSLDGAWGRSTALALLSWPLSNNKINCLPC